jgi:NDP-sugar pyrophosphorylase family protein
MKVLILAAGRSTRVKPVEDKNFLRFNGKFLIQHQIEMLQKAGLTDLILVTGAHNKARLSKLAADLVKKSQQEISSTELAASLKITITEQEDLTDGMAGAILSSSEQILSQSSVSSDSQGSLLIISSNDVVEESALKAVLQAAKSDPAGSKVQADAYLLAYEVEQYFPGGYLQVEGNKITSIVEKPGEGNEPSNLVNLVFHLHRDPKKLIEKLQTISSENDDRYEVALDSLMKEQLFQAVPYSGYWQAIKYPWHILDVMNFFLENNVSESPDGSEQFIHPSVKIADTAVVNGSVYIAEGVKIFDHSTIQGPAYIGKNSIIANNALVRNSILGENVVVGYSTEVARSFIGDGCWFHSNYIGDTVMGENVSFGAGAICANLRLDEKEITVADPKASDKNASKSSARIPTNRNKLGPILGSNIRLGVNTSLMPGVRVGSNSMIASGLTIAKDIPAGQFVTAEKAQTELKMRPNKAVLDENARDEMQKKMG